MITQTLAMLVDAYRDLNARKLFWITLILSVAVVALLAAFGVHGNSLTFLKWTVVDDIDASMIYRQTILLTLIIGIWLSWGAIILALISTAGLFPDLIASGAIDLYLSKPVSRVRLFLTRYLTGLLFVFLQITFFVTACFMVVGLRAHEWRPSLFLAIPLETLLFSYVYGFCVLLGVWTRSTISALLLSIVLWLAFSGIARLDHFAWTLDRGLALTIEHSERDIRRIDDDKSPATGMFDFHQGLARKRREAEVEALADARGYVRRVKIFHGITAALHAIFPKTVETNDLLDHYIVTDAELESTQRPVDPGPPFIGITPRDLRQATIESAESVRHAQPAYVVGASLLCEAVVVSLAAWIFCRRDY